MEEKKCDDVVKFPVEEDKNDFISWIHRNRKALLVGACCVLSYRFGYRAGRAEALSTFDHALTKLQDYLVVFDPNKIVRR